MMQKAYKLLAAQENISNKRAKELIDRGLVYSGDKKIKIARAQMPEDSRFRVEEPSDIEIIYQDDDMVVIDKPAFIESSDIEKAIEGARLLHRLDRETSGVLLLSRNEEFSRKAINAFRRREVKKVYVAWVEGVLYEELSVDLPISTDRRRGSAFSRVDRKRGKEAISRIYPDEVQGKKSKIRIEIDTGRTHQIRVHLAHLGYPIVGDERYGSATQSKRILLHAKRIELLGMSFEAPEPKEISRYK
jgi:23S rRNA pseudouridine1911/1915/1917 synthase